MCSRDPAATLTILSAEQAQCPTVPDTPAGQHMQRPTMTKDAPAAAGFGRAFTANVPFRCRASVVPGQKRAGKQFKLSKDMDTTSQ